MSGVLAGRTAIVTGASQGLGLAIARAYLDAGANVVICARDAAQLDAARNDLVSHSADARVTAIAADVSREEDVQRLVAAALAAHGRIDILVNNAGVYGPKGAIEEVDWAEWVRAIEINLFGSVLCARAVVPHLRRMGYGKIIQLSGGGATAPLPRISAYAASKTAIIRFAETLAEELQGSGVDVNSIAPGALNTRMLDEAVAAGPERVGAEFYERALKQRESGGAPLEKGAALAVFLASAASDGLTGRLLSAVWDAWPSLADNGARIAGTDVFTLRRIIPEDRGISLA